MIGGAEIGKTHNHAASSNHSLALVLICGMESKLTPCLLSQIFPKHRSSARIVGPGVEMREDPVERRKRQGGIDPDLMDATSLE